MKIAKITPMVLGTAWRNLTFVKVDTDEGLSGVGEVRMLNHTDALIGYLQEAGPNHVLGSDPFNIEDLVNRMYHNDFARVGQIAMSGISVIEIACWDIVGKALGVPVYKLLGGAVRPRIKAYANGWYTVERSPDQFAEAARRAVARGYHALKFDPFGSGFYELTREEKRRSIALTEAVREAVGPEVELLLEMHGRFNPATAIEIARLLEPYEPSWVEEPVPPDNLRALQKASEQIRLPVATGERLHSRAEFRELFELQACDIIQPDITHCGGILNTKKIAAWADTYYMLVAPHNVGGPVSTAAALHLAACTTNFKIQEHFNDFAEAWVKQAAPGLPEVEDGYFALPDKPGLGVELDEQVFKEHPRAAVFFNLYTDDWHRRQAQRATGAPTDVEPASALGEG
ncbi:MAG TPA: mandelate racemase/muconate lactonizing enzyme family protein [Herpetosiphonaceae bacterium]|nr:mandelate racemase/muconate lactonizing enzyme family protein [Herpetosiphonaceae bacterium]